MNDFFIKHTEKVVFAICIAIAGWFLYGAVTLSSYQKTPDDFRNVIARASQSVNQSEPKVDDLPPLQIDEEYAKLDDPVSTEGSSLAEPFFRPMELGLQFRDTPEVMPPAKPETLVNRGLLALSPKPSESRGDEKVFEKLLGDDYPAEMIWYFGNEEMVDNLGITPDKKAKPGERGQPVQPRAPRGDRSAAATETRGATWVEVVAAFPHADQLRAFIRTLQEGKDDVGVRYALAEIERQELTGSLEWTPFARIPWQKQFEVYDAAVSFDDPATNPNIQNAVVKGLVMLMPERAGPGSGKEDGAVVQTSAHLEPEEFEEYREPEWTEEEIDPTLTEDELAERKRQRLQEKDLEREVDNLTEKKRVAAKGGFDNANDVEFAMMRVFDFTVEPGKRYRYRIRAVLFNPNYNRADVADPDQALDLFLDGPWSEPSDEVYVSPSTELFANETRAVRDESAKFSLFHWLADVGVWVREDIDAAVGEIVGRNASKAAGVPVFDIREGTVRVQDRSVGSGFDTGHILLEMTPKNFSVKLGPNSSETISVAREVVLLNSYGDLIVKNEAVDSVDVATLSEEIEDLKTELTSEDADKGNRRVREKDDLNIDGTLDNENPLNKSR